MRGGSDQLILIQIRCMSLSVLAVTEDWTVDSMREWLEEIP